MGKKIRLNETKMQFICELRHHDISRYSKTDGGYRPRLTSDEIIALRAFEKSLQIKDFTASGVSLEEQLQERRKESKILSENNQLRMEARYLHDHNEQLQELLDIRDATNDIEIYKISSTKTSKENKDTTAILLLSDIHPDETVVSSSVLGLNEYNPEIARQRLEAYFINAVKLISHHQRSYVINDVVLGLIGDLISGYIHEELQQTNSMSPLEAVHFIKSIIMSGLSYFQENLDVQKIKVVCVAGNHGRTSKKIQHNNFTQMNYEYFLYKDLELMCQQLHYDKFEFIIPKCSMAIVEIYGKRYLFGHGHFFKYFSGIGGLYIPLLRWYTRIANLLNIERAFLGHWHTTVSIKEAVINGSVIGYTPFALDLGLPYEVPQQQMVLLNRLRGFTNQQSIYLD